MDSEANFHICRDENCFSSYEKIVDMIRTANGKELPICGIRSIRFRMHDGVVREVSGVRHVPTCSHNLFLSVSWIAVVALMRLKVEF